MPASSDAGGSKAGRCLLVVGADLILTKQLPAHGVLVLGRDTDCDVPLPHASISRRHARLLVDHDIKIEDVGSTNGIKVGGVRLERATATSLPLGEGLRLGPYTLIVLPASDAGASEDGLPRAALVVADPTIDGRTELLERIAQHDVNVLIHGETGSGKEVLARTLHTLSRRPGEMVAINCAALTGPLLESELFGHERGAFTGATRTKPGLLEVAGRGTALLDEIGDLPLELQGKLLRALESKQVYRVGGVQPIDLRARLIAATHRNLPDDVARGAFRQDLYFRVNGITLELRPLRERRGSILTLAQRFLDEAQRAAGVRPTGFAPTALAALTAHDWPGNVRELRLVIERAVLISGGATIDASHVLVTTARTSAALAERAVLLYQSDAIEPEYLPVEKLRATWPAPPARSTVEHAAESPSPHPHSATGARRPTPPTPPQEESLDFKKDSRERERKQIIAALKSAEGNQSKAAEILRISRRTLLTKLDVHKLPRPRKRS